MKSHILYIALFITVMARAQDRRQQSFSGEALINKTLATLNINKERTEFIVSKKAPSNRAETIIVITEIVGENESDYGLNSYILLVNNYSGKITHRFFETPKENGWVSNAEFVYDITIDTLNYKLNSSKNAFGITAKFRIMSRTNPYYSESFSLFTKDKTSLKKLLDNYPVYQSFGEVNINGCDSNIEKTTNVLSMNTTKTKGYSDIIITQKKSIINHSEAKNGDCKPKETKSRVEKFMLKFDGNIFRIQ